MKKTIFKALSFFAFAITLAACTQEETILPVVSAPGELTLPEDNLVVELQPSNESASVVFEWVPAEEGDVPQYEVVFSADGNFEQPLYVVDSDSKGKSNTLTVSHQILDGIARVASVKKGNAAVIKWTVFSYIKDDRKQASQVFTLNLVRPYGFDSYPESLYLIGAEDEPLFCKPLSEGVFEVFAKISPDKQVVLNEKADGTGTAYSIDSKKMLKEANEPYTFEENGIYRIVFNLKDATIGSMKKITRTGFYFCPNNADMFDLEYVGNGVFEATSVIVWSDSWGGDSRYKFRMYYEDEAFFWGTKNNTDSSPNLDGTTVDDTNPYFFITETAWNQWDQKWKLDRWSYNLKQLVKVSLVFNVPNYTHRIQKEGTVSIQTVAEPTSPNDTKVELNTTSDESVTFEWSKATVTKGGEIVLKYNVLFSKDGDFNNPLSSVESKTNSVSISHKVLDAVANAAGIKESGSIKWTVQTVLANDLKQLASQSKTLNLERGGLMYVIGADETGDVACAAVADGVYEVFVKLSAAKGVTLNTKSNGTGTSYCISGSNGIVAGNTGFNVPADGVYRIKFSMKESKVLSFNMIKSVALFAAAWERDEIAMEYVGNGVFQGTDTFERKVYDWGRDNRYKFRMVYSDDTKVYWCTKDGSNKNSPNKNGAVDDNDSYFFIGEHPYDRWNQVWSLDAWADGDQKIKASLVFNVTNYTHRIEKGN